MPPVLPPSVTKHIADKVRRRLSCAHRWLSASIAALWPCCLCPLLLVSLSAQLPNVQLYEKRKLAALEVEQLVKQLATAGKGAAVVDVIDTLVTNFATSSAVGTPFATGMLSPVHSMALEHPPRRPSSAIEPCATWYLPCFLGLCGPEQPAAQLARPSPPSACSRMPVRAACCAWLPRRWRWRDARPARHARQTCCRRWAHVLPVAAAGSAAKPWPC